MRDTVKIMAICINMFASRPEVIYLVYNMNEQRAGRSRQIVVLFSQLAETGHGSDL